MNCAEFNRIPIADILLKVYGVSPQKIKGSALWYSSPNKTDKTPSLKIRIPENDFIDFSSCNPAIGKPYKGRVIDLVCYLSSVDVKSAMRIITNQQIAPISSLFEKQTISTKKGITIKKVKLLTNSVLIAYLTKERFIPLKYAEHYIKEAYYTLNYENNNGKTSMKTFYSLAFKNDFGGYELRNKYWKGGTSPKGLTTISGSNAQLNIFEGFIDLLSAMTYFKTTSIKFTTIVLNSLSFFQQAKDLVFLYPRINLFLDNDEAGTSAAREIKNIHSNVRDYSAEIYSGYKDMNQLLSQTKR